MLMMLSDLLMLRMSAFGPLPCYFNLTSNFRHGTNRTSVNASKFAIHWTIHHSVSCLSSSATAAEDSILDGLKQAVTLLICRALS